MAFGSHRSSSNLEAQGRTTVLVKKFPKRISRDELVAIFDAEGFHSLYDFVYAPVDMNTRNGLGMAFVNFVSAEAAASFLAHFEGFCSWGGTSCKTCELCWSDLQGFGKQVEKYRNISIMHEAVPDEFKPALFKQGSRMDFPAPTRLLKAPRLRACRQNLRSARRLSNAVAEIDAPADLSL